MSHVAAIILAAGRGTRFGDELKLLAQIGGKALIRHVAEAAVNSLADPVIVVTGHRAERGSGAFTWASRSDRLIIPYSPRDFRLSLKAGFSALPPEARAAVILLGDMPFVEPSSSTLSSPAGEEEESRRLWFLS